MPGAVVERTACGLVPQGGRGTPAQGVERVQGWAAPLGRPKKRNCYFGYLWLFLVIFAHYLSCNILQ
jgi:hypothetical protein